MSKVFEKIDAINIVRLLQVAAIITFVVGVLAAVSAVQGYFTGPHTSLKTILTAFQILGMQVGMILYRPAVLLALAVIIKKMSEKK